MSKSLMISRKLLFSTGLLILCWSIILYLLVNFPIVDFPHPAISDFGRMADTDMFFNIGMIVCGVLLALFGKWQRNKYLIAAGIGLTGIGIFPLPPLQATVPVGRVIHWAFSGLLLFGLFLAMLRDPDRKGKILGLVSVIGFIIVTPLFTLAHSEIWVLTFFSIWLIKESWLTRN